MIADQEESGIIESIFDGIVRLTGLESIFYSELLFNVNLNYNADELLNKANEENTNAQEEEEDLNSTRTLMLVMGLERESIQAPMLTQTSQLYEGDLAWRTTQELEIYCSIEALGRISDIFLNSLE